MEIKTLSKERGITAIYNGEQYFIHSSFYGFVAKSTKIDRSQDTHDENAKIFIDFDMCDWMGYWDLAAIIKKGVKKMEQQFINKQVYIQITRRTDGRQALKERFSIVEDTSKL